MRERNRDKGGADAHKRHTCPQRPPSPLFAHARFVKVEDQVQLAHVPKVAVQHLHVLLDDLQSDLSGREEGPRIPASQVRKTAILPAIPQIDTLGTHQLVVIHVRAHEEVERRVPGRSQVQERTPGEIGNSVSQMGNHSRKPGHLPQERPGRLKPCTHRLYTTFLSFHSMKLHSCEEARKERTEGKQIVEGLTGSRKSRRCSASKQHDKA